MGMLGKILVMVHSLLSLGMLTWAVGVYTQRINWKSPNRENPGVFERQESAIADRRLAMNQAFYRWTGNQQSVLNFEAQRYPRRAFYTGQLNLLQYGATAPGGAVVDPAVQELASDPRTGYLDISRVTGRKPLTAPLGGNLKSVVAYERQMKKLYEDIRASQLLNVKIQADRELLNNEIIGVTKPALVKGLRQLINEQLLIADEAELEITYVGGFSTIREAEFGLLKKRKDALTGRMTELKKHTESTGKMASGN